MGTRNRKTGRHAERTRTWRWATCGMLAFFVLLTAWGKAGDGWAVQRYDAGGAGHAATAPAGGGHGEAQAATSGAGQAGGDTHGAPAQHAPATPGAAPGGDSHGVAPAAPGVHGGANQAAKGGAHGASPEHGEKEAHGAHGPAPLQISPTPGLTFVETMISLLEAELDGRTFGWRPNDVILGRFTDNVNNYQLGVLEALRFTTIRLKDSLTRMGDADTYDPDLEQALNLLMNRATLFIFPSAETSYQEAVGHLRNFAQKLQRGQRTFFYRKDNLQALLNAYKDLLGNVNKSLIGEAGWFKSDDYFYYAKGVAHVYYEVLRVVRAGFEGPLSSTLHARDIMDEVIHELYRVEEMDPWIVLDGSLDGFTANHRANLNAPLSEVTHLLGILSQI